VRPTERVITLVGENVFFGGYVPNIAQNLLHTVSTEFLFILTEYTLAFCSCGVGPTGGKT